MTLALLDMENPEPEKTLPQIRREMILDFYATYLNEMGEKCTEPFVKCLGTLRATFEAKDEDGEIYITYPDRKEWNDELRKFFYRSKDNWYRLNNRLTFFTFVKNYGRYNHHLPKVAEPQPLKIKPVVKETILKISCSKCGKQFMSNEYHDC